MRKNVKIKVLCCDVCQRIKPANKNTAGPFLPVISEKPNELIAVDFYGPLPRSVGGVEYILVILDVFSRLVTLYPLKKATALASIRCMQDYVEKIGRPARVLSDHATQFMSAKWRECMEEIDCKPIYCSIRHPQSNPSERVMRELGRFFRTYCYEKHTAWARYIKDIELRLNLSTYCVTGFTPYELHYGISPRSKIRSLIHFPREELEPHEIKIEIANKRTREAHEKRKTRVKPDKSKPFSVGDWVLLKVPKQSNALAKKTAKFFHVYYGPYLIARVFNEDSYELVDVDNQNVIIGHYNRIDLKAYRQLPTVGDVDVD